MVSKEILLDALPPFTGRSVLIENAQDVPDIMNEVVAAHKHFRNDYDTIFQFFDRGSVRDICKNLFDFCKRNIRYVVEGDRRQTTKSPAALLAQGYGDCKHYAGFIAGVLSAITRNTGKKIWWKYRFASYSVLNSDPGHVYVVVENNGDEISIDPVLKSFNDAPLAMYVVDKKFKDMPLYRVSGVGAVSAEQVQQYAQYAVTAYSFIKKFTGDKVPNYPIKSPDTLDKIRAEIQMLLPVPPTSLDDAERLLQKARELQAPLAGDSDNVRKTYYLIYGEIIAALESYLANGGRAPGSSGSGFEMSNLLSTKNILIAGGLIAGIYFYSRRKRKVSGGAIGILPALIVLAASTIIHFVKKANEDQVPDYPIKKSDTLDKIRAEIYMLLPVPPTSIANAQDLLKKARELQAPLAGNTGTVEQTYYMIYGEIINALLLYLDERAAEQVQGQGETVVNPQIDPITGERIQTATAADTTQTAGGSNLLLLGGVAAAAFFFDEKETESFGENNEFKNIALAAGGIWLVQQMTKTPAPAPAVTGYNGNGKSNITDYIY